MANRIAVKLRNLPQGVKASIGFFISSVITSGIAYITTPLYTRMLSTEEYGQASVFLTWVQLFGIVAMFCLSYGVFNNGMVDFPDKRDEYSLSMLALSNIITIAFSVLLIALYPLFSQYLRIKFSYLVLMCVLFFFQPAYNFWTARQRYELKYKWTLLWSVICAFFSPLVALVCISLFPDHKLDGRIFGAEISLILIYVGFYYYLARKGNFHINRGYWKTALLFNLPLIPHYLSTYVLSSSDRLMISNFVSDSATAYYSVAGSVAAIAMIVWGAINSTLIPFTYEKCKKEEFEDIRKLTSPILLIFAAISSIIIMFAPEVVKIMATDDYMEAVYAIPPIIGGIFFQVQYYLYANVVYYYKKPKYVMIGSVIAAMTNIILNYIFIKAFGYLSAGYTTLICYIIQAAIDFWAMRKVSVRMPYDSKIIFVLSIVVILISLLSNMLYGFFIIRYVIILFILVIAFVLRRRIILMFKELQNK